MGGVYEAEERVGGVYEEMGRGRRLILALGL